MADGKETQRSLAKLRAEFPSSAVEKVEHWDHYAQRRHDLFGIADVLVAGPDSGFLLVQVTTRKQMSARRSKIKGKRQGTENPANGEYRVAAAKSWLEAGGRILIQGWEQPGGKGTRWECTEWEVSMEDFDDGAGAV